MPRPKPRNQASPKLEYIITSWTTPGMQNFVSICSGVSTPRIRDFAGKGTLKTSDGVRKRHRELVSSFPKWN